MSKINWRRVWRAVEKATMTMGDFGFKPFPSDKRAVRRAVEAELAQAHEQKRAADVRVLERAEQKARWSSLAFPKRKKRGRG